MDYITQEEYLLALAEELKYLNPKDATKVLQYYQNKINTAIDYGEKEKDVIERLPSPSEVAKDTYNSHSINYLEIRKRKFKRKQTFNKIIDSILSLMVIISFFVVMYYVISSIGKMASLTIKIFNVKDILDKFISGFAVITYTLVIVLLCIYIIDLFIIILSYFLNNIIKLKDEDLQRKIFTFTITGFIEEKTKTKKLQLKTIIGLAGLSIILMIASVATKGYLYSSLNNLPSQTANITLNEATKSFNITANNANIYFKNSTTNQLYLEYQYELDKKLNIKEENNQTTINILDTVKYDVLGLLNEPTQNVIIYLPNTYTGDLNITLNNGTIDVSDVSLNKTTIKTLSKGIVSFVNSNISSIDIEGYNLYFAIYNSFCNDVSYTSNKGQFIIQENSQIKNLKIENHQAQLKFNDSYIENTTLTNSSGEIAFINMSGNMIDYKSKSSLNTFNDSTFKEMNFDISLTCSLTFTRIIADNINIKSTNSYVIIDYIKTTNTIIESNTSNIFVTGFGRNYPGTIDYEYNKKVLDCSLTIKNQSSNSKTEIVDSTIKTGAITQDQGFLLFKDSYIETGTLNMTSCHTVELIDLDGIKLDLYIAQIEETIVIDSEVLRELVFNVKQWDIISSANMVKNEDTIKFQVEEEN